MNAHILGMGHFVPEHVVSNADLAKRMDTSDEWIQQRTGILERHHITHDTGASDLAYEATRRALAAARLTPGDIDFVLLGTLSPDVDMPASACFLARRLGLRDVPAMDVRNQCSGFLYMLALADKLVRTGTARHVLVVGAEVHSTGLELATPGREVAVIFGDGAGAAIIGPEPDATKGILTTHLHSEGKWAEKLWLEAPAHRTQPRLTADMIGGPERRVWPKMEGRFVFKHAVTRIPEVIGEALAATGLTLDDIDLLVPHQANLRINQMVAAGLGLPEEKVANNIHRFGNTTAASIPIALDEAIEAGRVKPGSLVCLAGFGSGFTWGCALIRW